MWIYSLAIALLGVLYLRMFHGYRRHWVRMSRQEKGMDTYPVSLSVIVPFRNEARNIPPLIKSFLAQKTDAQVETEYLFVDDHSDDEGFQLISDSGIPRLKLFRLSGNQIGKKAAVEYAISQAAGDYMLLTDADTTRGEGWLQAFADEIRKEAPVLISGPVQIVHASDFFSRWQALEFSGLIGIGGASLFKKSPNMCNGANLCYRRAAFSEVGGFTGNAHLLSGDDEFLMHKLFERYPDGLRFLKNEEAIVYTAPQAGVIPFLQQRMRWASKARYYSRKQITWSMGVAFLYTAGILIGFALSISLPEFLIPAGLALLLKMWAEYRFYQVVLPFFGQNHLLKLFLPAEIVQLFYLPLTGVLGTFVKYRWKGRQA